MRIVAKNCGDKAGAGHGWTCVSPGLRAATGELAREAAAAGSGPPPSGPAGAASARLAGGSGEVPSEFGPAAAASSARPERLPPKSAEGRPSVAKVMSENDSICYTKYRARTRNK